MEDFVRDVGFVYRQISLNIASLISTLHGVGSSFSSCWEPTNKAQIDYVRLEILTTDSADMTDEKKHWKSVRTKNEQKI